MDTHGYSETVKNSTARKFGSCNPLRIHVGARHGVPRQGFFHRFSVSGVWAARWLLTLGAAGALVLTLAPSSRAENADAQPEALSKQRAALYLEATRGPLANLENDLNHLALLSEKCRVEYGTQACGLSDKPLESDKLEERYAYYVKGPVEARSKGEALKIDRGHWGKSSGPPAR